ncbi:MAG: PD40 domain-containing protein [Flavobacteriales bacterium]|nr:PD40 domain-containing protein [Flavobacteriales bacterium]
MGAWIALAPMMAQTGYKRVHNKMLDDAKVLLAEEHYLEAARIYRRLEPMDTAFTEVSYELAQCALHIPGGTPEATKLLERCVRQGHVEAMYDLGLLRHQQLRSGEAIELFGKYRTSMGRLHGDAEIDRRIAAARTAREMIAHPVDAGIRNLGDLVNSPAHDYCPLVTADGNTMYFTSRRDGSTGSQRDPSGRMYEDIYMVRRMDGIWSNAVNVGLPLNSAVHDATVGLGPDGMSMIIYRTSPDMVSGDLHESRRNGTLWQNPVRMTDRINSGAHEPSASISPSGSEIFFTSDRPGGFGGRDIYRIRRLPNGEWSLPLNLGPTVNTADDEDAPFMHSDGLTLFFSSKGHATMGGYDIFKTVNTDPDRNAWSEPENMGYPLNTVNDDIYFCLSEDGRTGYFSSERTGGLGGQDIYTVEFPSTRLEYVVVRGLVTDAGDEPVKARITLTDAEGAEIVGVYNANERTGRYLMVLRPASRYRMVVEARGFDSRVSDLATGPADEDGRELTLDIQLTRNENTARITK